MYLSPYDTLACRTLIMTKIITAVESAQVAGRLIDSSNQDIHMPPGFRRLPKDVAIFLEQSAVDQFSHPIIISGNSSNDHKSIVVVDGRNMAKSLSYLQDKKFIPNNFDMYEFQMLRAGITAMLLRNETTSLSSLVSPVTKVTSLWIQRAVTRQYPISQEIASIVQICGAIYCYALFSGSSVANDEAKQLWGARIRRDFPFFNNEVVEKVLSVTTAMTDVVQLVETIKRAADTPILKTLEPQSFLQAIGSGWDAFHAREMMTVAIEHLPTLIAVIAKSQSQSFNKTGISRHVKEVFSSSSLRDFLQLIARLPLVEDSTHHSYR